MRSRWSHWGFLCSSVISILLTTALGAQVPLQNQPNVSQRDGRATVLSVVTETRSCCDETRGDVNDDGEFNVADLVFLVDWGFRGGPTPPCFEEADVNADGSINIGDLTYIVDGWWWEGPAPVDCP
jgi:hypothetical protein